MVGSEQATTVDAAHAPHTLKIPATPQSENAKSKRDLAAWWKHFKKATPTPTPTPDPRAQGTSHSRSFRRGSHNMSLDAVVPSGPSIFGVPLEQSICYANIAISLYNEQGEMYVYGYVPIVVAKCGNFLKDKGQFCFKCRYTETLTTFIAMEVEGIFRLAGSEKRIKELKTSFDTPEKYGRHLDWTGYTVHDAANVLRRYLNQLPEPIIPLNFYQHFRDPIKHRPGATSKESSTEAPFDKLSAIRIYQTLITQLAPLNRQLLLYILDLLAVFAGKAEFNKMTNENLSAIFQPCLLSHPDHDMAPQEYRWSQDVLVFLIENQDHFLIGMHGTASDEQTVNILQTRLHAADNRAVTPTNGNENNSLGRSASTSSAGGDNIRRYGKLRRNVSVSSRDSPNAPSIVSLTPGAITPGSGLQRSNTVPSKRVNGGTTDQPRFVRERSLDHSPSPHIPDNRSPLSRPDPAIASRSIASPTGLAPAVRPQPRSASSSETVTPALVSRASPGHVTPVQADNTTKPTAPITKSPDINAQTHSESSSGHRSLLSKLLPSSHEEHKKDQKQPKKLQKKRRDTNSLSSAHSSVNDLLQSEDDTSSAGQSSEDVRQPSTSIPAAMARVVTPSSARGLPIGGTPQRTATDATLRPTSPSVQSIGSHGAATELSDAELASSPIDASYKKHSLQSSKQQRSDVSTTHGSATPIMTSSTSGNDLRSVTTEGSGSHGSKSIEKYINSSDMPSSPTDHMLSDSEEKKRGPVSWLKGKLAERKDKDGSRLRATSNPDMDNGKHVQSLGMEKVSDDVKPEAVAVSSQSRELAEKAPVAGIQA